MKDVPKDGQEEEIEYEDNDSLELWQLLDWIFYAGNSIPLPEPENEEEEEDESDIQDDGLGSRSCLLPEYQWTTGAHPDVVLLLPNLIAIVSA